MAVTGSASRALTASVAPRARATASFPGAFEPVDEAELGAYRVRGEIDLAARGETGGAVLIDGGVLDNTPFEPLLTEIGRRPVSSEWRRVIGYVTAEDGLVPAPDSPGGRRLARDWFPVLNGALRMGSESSFRNGVNALARRSIEAERQVRGTEKLFGDVLRDAGARIALPAPSSRK